MSVLFPKVQKPREWDYRPIYYDKDGVYSNLKDAIAKDASFKSRAKEDIEFAKFAEEADFQAIIK